MDIYQNLLKTKNSGLANKPMITPKVDLDVLGAPGEITSLGRIETLLKSPLKPPYQGNIPSCVHCTIKFLNDYNSYYNDKNPVDLSWLYTYAQVRHFAGGTSVDESVNVVCDKGQSQDRTFPSRVAIQKGDAWAQNAPIPQEAHDEAKNWRAKESLKVSGARLALYTALVQTPLGVGANVGDGWDTNGTIKYINGRFGHMFALLDILDAKNVDLVRGYTGFSLTESDYGNWISVNWWKDENKFDVRILDKNYPIFWGRILVDITDTVFIEKKEKKNMKTVKVAEKPEIYLLDETNRLHWVANEESFARFINKENDFANVEIVTQEVLDSYQMGEPMNVVWNNVGEMIKFYVKHKLLNFE